MILNQKGQALIEFILLLPIFIFMLFAVIDLGKILYIKNNLEGKMEEVVSAVESKSLEEVKKDLQLEKDFITVEVQTGEKYKTIFLKKNVEILTPGLNLLLKNPYEATAKRVILNE